MQELQTEIFKPIILMNVDLLEKTSDLKRIQ